MSDPSPILPQCRERFDDLQRDLGEIKADVKCLRTALVDDPDHSLSATVNRHRAYWRLFAVLATLVALACTVAGTLYAAVK